MKSMNWFEKKRQDWIAETLCIFGFIQRQHLMRKFSISMVQASKDLQKFSQNCPGWMEYNAREKRYVFLGEQL